VQPLVIHGWRVMCHPLLLEQAMKLVAAARDEMARGQTTGPNRKLLAAVTRLMFDTVPADPLHKDYRQGDTLGPRNRHWFRAKFGNGRFRLFFRCSSQHRTIVFAWVNDDKTKRTYGASEDAYAVFARMLAAGNPPGDMTELMSACAPESDLDKLRAEIDRLGSDA
jgi:toxin YhaV